MRSTNTASKRRSSPWAAWRSRTPRRCRGLSVAGTPSACTPGHTRKLTALDPTAMKREFELGLSGGCSRRRRSDRTVLPLSYLAHSKSTLAYVRSRGVGIFGIHVDSRDFLHQEPRRRAAQRPDCSSITRRRASCCFTTSSPRRPAPSASLIDELKKRGYKFVHIVPKSTRRDAARVRRDRLQDVEGQICCRRQQPIATRAATWPVSGAAEDGGSQPGPRPPRPRARPAHGPPGRQPFDWANPSNDPWQLRAFGTQ